MTQINKKSNTINYIVKGLGFASFIIFLDQYTKLFVLRNLDFNAPIKLTAFADIRLAYNSGASFSILANAGGWQNTFFMIIGIFASICIILYFMNLLLRVRIIENIMINAFDASHFGSDFAVNFYSSLKLNLLALTMLFGGTVGNLIDRIRFGHVIDFIDLHLGAHHWPTFNFADSAICVGVCLFVFLHLRVKLKR